MAERKWYNKKKKQLKDSVAVREDAIRLVGKLAFLFDPLKQSPYHWRNTHNKTGASVRMREGSHGKDELEACVSGWDVAEG